MTTTTRARRTGALCTLLLAGCLGTPSPALPPVRWFDPLPEAPRGGAAVVAVRVTAPPHLGRELCVRVGPRELAFDAGNQWMVEPAHAVGIVAGRALAAREPATVPELALEAFELDVTGPPRAYVRVVVLGAEPGRGRMVEASAGSSGRAPAEFAAAMAAALAELQQRLGQR